MSVRFFKFLLIAGLDGIGSVGCCVRMPATGTGVIANCIFRLGGATAAGFCAQASVRLSRQPHRFCHARRLARRRPLSG